MCGSKLEESIGKMIVNGNRLELPTDEQFSNYAEVKKCLIKAGGKYKRCGFDFTECAQEIKSRLVGGEAIDDVKKFQYFPTPDHVVDLIMQWAEVTGDCEVLEPSAGQGAISNRVDGCKVIELMPQNIKALQRQGYNVIEGDFLKHSPDDTGCFDRILANPPFTKNQDIDHVLHMFEFLKPGGRIVTVMSRSWIHGSQKKQVKFRKWLDDVGGEIVLIDSGEFKSSGTMVPTVLVIIVK